MKLTQMPLQLLSLLEIFFLFVACLFYPAAEKGELETALSKKIVIGDFLKRPNFNI